MVRVDLAEVESSLLAGLFDDFADALTRPDLATTRSTQRLFPDGYTDDDEAAAEYRELVEADLRAAPDRRSPRLPGRAARRRGRISLDDEAADRWLRVLNDLRLALGTRFGIDADTPSD